MESKSVEEPGEGPQSVRLSRWARIVAFLVVTLGMMGGLHYYIGLRLVAGSGLTGWAAALGWGLLAFLFVSVPLGFMASRRAGGWLAAVLYWIAHLWLGSFGLVLTLVVLGDVARLVYALLAGGLDAARAQAWGQVQALGGLAALVPVLVYGYRAARGPARIEQVEVPMARLGPALDGLRIVQISDLHIGETLRRPFLERVVREVNALQPDIVAITGDLVDGSVARLRDEVAPLQELRAPQGVYFVTGNHEYYHGAVAWVAELRRLGLTVLHNEHRVIRRGSDALVLAGVTDLHGGQFDPRHACRPDLALAGVPEGAPRVLLAHQPRTAALARGLGVDLQLSGHTHGGQIFPFMFFVRLQQPVVSGLKELSGIRVYTSRGTGYWGPPLRVGSAPEITVLTLRAPSGA